jgi:hypothetical protein
LFAVWAKKLLFAAVFPTSMQKHLLAFCFVLIILPATAFGQSHYTSLKFFGLSLHPYGDENAHLMPLNPDNKGYLVLNTGATLSHEIPIFKGRHTIKIMQALYADCAAQTGGFSHIGLRGTIFKKNRHELSGGLGPTLIFRRNWHRLADYVPSGFFKGGPSGNWQYKFLWYGGELEYHYQLNLKTAFSLTFIPGFPNLISLSAGLRFTH